MSGFRKAEKKKAWIKVALTGPSGAGKTYSALKIARGMGGKIAFIDTENGSASLYADEFDFDVLEIDAPYTVKKFIEAIDQALRENYSIIVIDSISHVWAGEGGLLAQKEELDARGASGDRKNKNQYANWASITKEHEKFKAWLLKADCHMICTMRSKQDYALGDDGKVKKFGFAPVQREGMEYEFTLVLDLAMNHSAGASKDRTKLFDGQFFTPSEATGEALIKWLNSGKGELTKVPHAKIAPESELEEIGKSLDEHLSGAGAFGAYRELKIDARRQQTHGKASPSQVRMLQNKSKAKGLSEAAFEQLLIDTNKNPDPREVEFKHGVNEIVQALDRIG